MKKEKIIILIVVLAIIAVAIFSFYYLIPRYASLRKRVGVQESILENLAKEGKVIEITSEGFKDDFGKEITIEQGETVYFVNKDKEAHTLVRELKEGTASLKLEPVSTITFPFLSFGEFTFYLEKWPQQKLKIIIE